jgi:hypothetical protein
VNGNVFIDSPPTQYTNGTPGSGGVLGWDYISKQVVLSTIEYYHSGPYNSYYQVNWNGLNKINQFYKKDAKQCLWIIGYATAYRSSAGWQDIQIRLYNQSNYTYYYFASYQFYNVVNNHQPISVNIDAGALPPGYYDVYTYFVSGGQATDTNEVLSLTYAFMPNGITSA